MKERERFRNKRLTLRLTEEEYKLLSDKAELCELNINAFLRKIIFSSDIVVNKIPVDEIMECQKAITENAFELNKIGNNINQIAKVIHENNDTYSKSQIEEFKRYLDNVTREYERLCSVMISNLYGLE